jgi:GNAT superfamily N-acetyltransferase
MPALDVIVESGINLSIRARQVCGMFDCPPEKKQKLRWKAELPLDDRAWSIGLIVGPSGCGKSTCAKALWPAEYAYTPKWDAPTIIDCFDPSHSVESIAGALNSVGFSTIPAWLRPYGVLSNGERFRAEIARRLLEQPGLIVVDEFTSVVDRQVATVACHAVQKFVRKRERQLVAVTCHSDVIDWLQPDWVFEPAERAFRWRCLQRRPEIQVEVARVPFDAWRIFAPFHYMTADLNKAAACFGLWAGGELAAFGGVLHKPHATAKNIKGLSRLVTLPDWQGLGLAFVLTETLGAAYKALGFRYRNYPAHPSFIRAFRPEKWTCVKQPGTFSPAQGRTSSLPAGVSQQRPCAVMEYIGPAMSTSDARRLLD